MTECQGTIRVLEQQIQYLKSDVRVVLFRSQIIVLKEYQMAAFASENCI